MAARRSERCCGQQQHAGHLQGFCGEAWGNVHADDCGAPSVCTLHQQPLQWPCMQAAPGCRRSVMGAYFLALNASSSTTRGCMAAMPGALSVAVCAPAVVGSMLNMACGGLRLGGTSQCPPSPAPTRHTVSSGTRARQAVRVARLQRAPAQHAGAARPRALCTHQRRTGQQRTPLQRGKACPRLRRLSRTQDWGSLRPHSQRQSRTASLTSAAPGLRARLQQPVPLRRQSRMRSSRRGQRHGSGTRTGRRQREPMALPRAWPGRQTATRTRRRHAGLAAG